MNVDELSDLLEKEKTTTREVNRPIAFADLPQSAMDWMEEQTRYERETRFRPEFTHNPIDAIQRINGLMASIRPGNMQDLEGIYINLQDMSRRGLYMVARMDVQHSRDRYRGRQLTIELINGTRLVYDV